MSELYTFGFFTYFYRKGFIVKAEGNLLKMRSALDDPVSYHLPVGSAEIHLNALLGKPIRVEYQHRINCIRCGRETSKSFVQGYCYPCFISAPETDACILHPERCRAHEGISRDMEWSKHHCLIDHYVYLALSGGLKVGVTRHSQVPTRWIDQGARKAIRIARTANRYTAGLIEVFLKNHMNDKTNWRHMLTNQLATGIDLQKERNKVRARLPEEYADLWVDEDEILEIHYPVLEYSLKVKSLNFDKDNVVAGQLQGIKGQYLILDGGRVINIRKFGGYRVIFET